MKVHNITVSEVKINDFSFTALTLGEKGRGRVLVNVACPQKFEYLEIGTTKQGKPRLNASKSSKGWLARISTHGAYIRGATGNVSTNPEIAEKIKVIARGKGAFGDAGRTGTWDDILILTELENFWLRVKPTRGDAYLLIFNQEKVTKISYEDLDIFVENTDIDIDVMESTTSSRGSLQKL